MNSRRTIQPRAAHHLRNIQAARLVANACAQLPVGFWQRRLAARAFGLSVVPPIDRERPSHALCLALGGVEPVFAVETGVALWAFAPRSAGDHVDILQMLRAVGRREFTAVIRLVPTPGADREGLVSTHRSILRSNALQIGMLHWDDCCEVFEEAATDLAHEPSRQMAAQAAGWLRTLVDAEMADVTMCS